MFAYVKIAFYWKQLKRQLFAVSLYREIITLVCENQSDFKYDTCYSSNPYESVHPSVDLRYCIGVAHYS